MACGGPARDSPPRTHPRPRGPPLPREVPLHGRPPRLVPPPQRPDRVPRRLLVLVEGTDPFDGAPSRLPLPMGAARTWRLAPGAVARDDENGPRALPLVDEIGGVAFWD